MEEGRSPLWKSTMNAMISHIVVVFSVKRLDLHLHARHMFTPKAKGPRGYPFIPCEVRVHDMNVSKCQQVNWHER